jgi:hypothetical protein
VGNLAVTSRPPSGRQRAVHRPRAFSRRCFGRTIGVLATSENDGRSQLLAVDLTLDSLATTARVVLAVEPESRTHRAARCARGVRHQASRSRTSANDGLVAAVPSANTTVGTVWLPPLTPMT